jgi:hypothetical protein
MFTIDLRTICWGLDSLFLLKSVPFSGTEPKLPCAQLRRWFSLHSDPVSHIVYNFILSPKVPVCVLHLRNIISHVFEDLRKTKSPNSIHTDKLFIRLTKTMNRLTTTKLKATSTHTTMVFSLVLLSDTCQASPGPRLLSSNIRDSLHTTTHIYTHD